MLTASTIVPLLISAIANALASWLVRGIEARYQQQKAAPPMQPRKVHPMSARSDFEKSISRRSSLAA